MSGQRLGVMDLLNASNELAQEKKDACTLNNGNKIWT